MEHDNGEEYDPFGGCQEQSGFGPLFIFFPIKKHPAHEVVEQCFGQYVGDDDTRVNTNDEVLRQPCRAIAHRLGVEEKHKGKEQTGLQKQEILEMQFVACLRDDGCAFAWGAEEVLEVSLYEVSGLGNRHGRKYKATQQNGRDEVVVGNIVGYGVARNPLVIHDMLWYVCRIGLHQRLAVVHGFCQIRGEDFVGFAQRSFHGIGTAAPVYFRKLVVRS